jgi:hypothetical protein
MKVAQLLDEATIKASASARVVIDLPGRYSLANRRNARGDRREFACRAINVTPHAIALAVPVSGSVGERVIAHVDGIGRLDGAVACAIQGGFIMGILASAQERAILENKIKWLGSENAGASDKRTSKRFVPKKSHAQLLQSDGTFSSCLLIDLSETDVAVSADVVPPLGTVLAVGQIVGRVARIFGEGFAVRFIDRQDREDVERRVGWTFGTSDQTKAELAFHSYAAIGA